MVPLATEKTSRKVYSRAYYAQRLCTLIYGRVVKPKAHPCKSATNTLRILLERRTSPIKLELFTDDSQKGTINKKNAWMLA
jgi:hypothetical protein